MFLVVIPYIFIILIVLAAVGVVSSVLDVNLMPIVSILSAIFTIVGLIKVFTAEEDEARKPHIVLTIVSTIIFFLSLGGSLTTGDILSWLWYTF